jgi:predicted phage tail protein
MSDTDVYVSPTRVPALIALALAVVGGALMAFSFVNGISAALDGGGTGAGLYVVLFFVGAALVLAALVTSIICLARGKARGLSALALIVALVPIVAIVVLRLAATA